MSVNIVLLVKDRPRLTDQALRTLYANTSVEDFNLVIVDDGSAPQTAAVVNLVGLRGNCRVVTFNKGIGILGFLKNVGIWTSERVFGRSDFVMVCDNDVAFFPHWLQAMNRFIDRTDLLGGCRHPYHGVNDRVQSFSDYHQSLEVTDAVAGYSHFMAWKTWDRYGPYEQHMRGIGQSEDFALCQKIVKDGGRVGYVHPPVMAHTGITNSDGKPAVGHEQFQRMEGLIYE